MSDGVMVALQFLVLPVKVRVLVGQQITNHYVRAGWEIKNYWDFQKFDLYSPALLTYRWQAVR